MAFAGAPADEHRAHTLPGQVRGERFHGIEVQRAVSVKGRVRRGNEAAERRVCDHGVADEAFGRMSRTRNTESSATPANAPKIMLSGTCRSRSAPKAQSPKPPHEMLTRFI